MWVGSGALKQNSMVPDAISAIPKMSSRLRQHGVPLDQSCAAPGPARAPQTGMAHSEARLGCSLRDRGRHIESRFPVRRAAPSPLHGTLFGRLKRGGELYQKTTHGSGPRKIVLPETLSLRRRPVFFSSPTGLACNNCREGYYSLEGGACTRPSKWRE